MRRTSIFCRALTSMGSPRREAAPRDIAARDIAAGDIAAGDVSMSEPLFLALRRLCIRDFTELRFPAFMELSRRACAGPGNDVRGR